MRLLDRLLGRRRVESPVIIVSGLPRSGTSMLMGMLSAGGVPLVEDGIRQADEDNPKGYYELEQVKELDKSDDKSWVRDARGKGLKVVSSLLHDLPDDCRYKVIFSRRHLSEVLASQKKMLAHRGESTDDVSDEEMARHFSKHLLGIHQWLDARANFEVLYVDHREALEDPARAAAAINEFLGGNLDTTAMAAVVDRQLYRNRIQQEVVT